ncbi:triglyceride lipase [Ascoidea rubescens DSM 1968]|uniref:Alpha/beta-hydrolase n=1 Tax=Ascoidea rubescens DSM 1968 TaxID=1344418 RepID=A0A1D2VLG3_9ASCO|nr:alpha/beta-hydrolase [Ascoidea rubescens DSM 1968]ODV62449.1 alpha/beta-hydrolase [Ascoidea rubescens DSM 1968]
MKEKLFTKIKKTTKAVFPRSSRLSTLSSEDVLSIVYNEFESTLSCDDIVCNKNSDSDKVVYNLVFLHGTGMNKEIWNYHIEKIFEYCLVKKTEINWKLGKVISVDMVNHCDSYLLNRDKLGVEYNWIDGSKDVIKIMKEEKLYMKEEKRKRVKNILIGHSLGGFQVLMIGFLEPNLVDSILSIDPVIYTDGNNERTIKRFSTLYSSILKSEFKNLKECKEYFYKKSIFKDFHPRILEDYMKSEINYVEKNGERRIELKSNVKQQMATYMSVFKVIKTGMRILELISKEIEVVHIIGTKARWNDQRAYKYIREKIQNCQKVDIENAKHLLNCEEPDRMVTLIVQQLHRRAQEKQTQRRGSDSETRAALFESEFQRHIEDRLSRRSTKL